MAILRSVTRTCVALLCITLAAAPTAASGAVAGVVADETGAVLPGATELSRWTPGLTVVDQGARSTFGEISRDLGDRWRVTAGGRWFGYRIETGSLTEFPSTPMYNSPFTGFASDDSGMLFKASVRYRIDDATNLYFTRSEGYRIGGGNNFRVCSNEEIALLSDADPGNDPPQAGCIYADQALIRPDTTTGAAARLWCAPLTPGGLGAIGEQVRGGESGPRPQSIRATQGPHRRRVPERIRLDRRGAQRQVGEEGTRAADGMQLLAWRVRRRQEFQGHRPAHVASDGKDAIVDRVELHHDVAVRPGTGSHLAAPFGNRPIGWSPRAA